MNIIVKKYKGKAAFLIEDWFWMDTDNELEKVEFENNVTVLRADKDNFIKKYKNYDNQFGPMWVMVIDNKKTIKYLQVQTYEGLKLDNLPNIIEKYFNN